MGTATREDLIQILNKRLRMIALGAVSMLNNISFRRYRVDFATLLVTDPLRAYEVLLEYTKGDKRQARLLLRSVLVAVIPPSKLLEAIDALENGDPEPLLEGLGLKGGGL